MAGGKETPRQKMIGMMYLVLTALLALNVSKQVVAAFVTLNGKLHDSGLVIDGSTVNIYGTFDSKRAALKATKGDMKSIDFWQGKADILNKRTKSLTSHILGESNFMIQTAEGQDWVAERDENGRIVELKSLLQIQQMDNFDIPTHIFVGSEANKPNARGMAIRDSIHKYRDDIAILMATYPFNGKNYSFTPPADLSGLSEALRTANPDDTSTIAQFYRSLTIPAMVEVADGGETAKLPWSAAMFNHSPIVAAAAILTSIKLDVLNAENRAAGYFLSKVDAPTFNFNKIEPLAFARTGYINAGDSLQLRVMIAAYDSTEISKIRYGVNDSTPGNWKETSGAISLDGRTPGDYRATGVIGVREKGEITWKPWSFNYTVGKPQGTVSLPEMNVLYRGYDNKVEGAASGYPSFSLSGGGNVTISKGAKGYIAKPGSGREATINISGVAQDGTSTSLGGFKFRVQNLPKPSISLGRIASGESATSAELRAANRLFAGYPPEIPLDATFSVVNWEMSVSGAPKPIQGTGSALSGEALRLISNAQKGAMVSVSVTYREPGGTQKRQAGVYKVK
ncbi:MAG: hypothetical protein H3C31_00535 [Brumimicrobium sp.]|nr:hypothetical protein [Brumimicrobium sp.]MCO5268128.1 hypothetical protein [Brumimicrobium sp.]